MKDHIRQLTSVEHEESIKVINELYLTEIMIYACVELKTLNLMMAIYLIFMNKSCFISLFKIVLLPLQKYIIPGLQYEVNSIT